MPVLLAIPLTCPHDRQEVVTTMLKTTDLKHQAEVTLYKTLCQQLASQDGGSRPDVTYIPQKIKLFSSVWWWAAK